jgi:hypothetical protein
MSLPDLTKANDDLGIRQKHSSLFMSNFWDEKEK